MPSRKIYIVLASIFITAPAYSQRLIEIRLDDTSICIPAAYLPDSSFMNRMLSPIADLLDSSDGSERLHIPASEIKKRVPGYMLSHTNSRGVELEHKLSGIAYAASYVGNPNGSAEAAWRAYTENSSVFIEEDPQLPYLRLYRYSGPTFMWSLVESPPPRTPDGTPPPGWFIASCSEIAGSTTCRQSVYHKSIEYDFRVYVEDMHLREEINLAVSNILDESERNCQ